MKLREMVRRAVREAVGGSIPQRMKYFRAGLEAVVAAAQEHINAIDNGDAMFADEDVNIEYIGDRIEESAILDLKDKVNELRRLAG